MKSASTPRASSRRWNDLRVLVPLFLIAAGIGAFYLLPSNPCGLPLHYAIGALDPRFGIDRKEVVARAKEAQAMWEKRVGQKLFVYDESSNLRINFIFDERQQAVIDHRALDQLRADVTAIDRRTQTAANEVEARYEGLKSQYEARLADFESRAVRHTAAVESWNRRGGAPPRVFEALSQETQDLKLEGDYLESLRQQVNRTADGVHAIVRTGKSVVDRYNTSAVTFNPQPGRHPDEQAVCIKDGDQRPVAIQVYELADPADLVRSLAHEFGHALGVEHEDDPKSIMKEAFESGDKDLEITEASVSTLKAACHP